MVKYRLRLHKTHGKPIPPDLAFSGSSGTGLHSSPRMGLPMDVPSFLLPLSNKRRPVTGSHCPVRPPEVVERRLSLNRSHL